MAQTKLKGNVVNLVGELPAVGSDAPDFSLTKTDLSETTLKDYAGKKVVLNIFPSLDTAVCAASVRKFNAEISKHPNAVAVCASLDLPFAHKRFCAAEGLEDVISASELRERKFGEDYGVRLADGGLAGLFARAIVIVDEQGKVTYTQLVPEITEEPNYDEALAAL